MTTRCPGGRRAPARNAGVGLVSAIFLLVVLAALSTALLTVFTSQQSSSSMDEQGARAYQAARAGIEWGLFQQLRNNSCQAQAWIVLPAGGPLDGFAVSVTCTPSGPAGLARWRLVATACNPPPGAASCPEQGNSADYVRRRLEARI